WALKELAVGNYDLAHAKAQKCIQLDENRASCWWWKGMTEILQKNIEEAKNSIQTAQEKGYRVDGPQQLGQLARAYAAAGYYVEAREAAQELLLKQPENREQIEAFLNSLPN
ncbi:MAG: hypothetical protein Q8P03_00700, partial [bacterium]|nr:hypothetical protein [bacterium]